MTQEQVWHKTVIIFMRRLLIINGNSSGESVGGRILVTCEGIPRARNNMQQVPVHPSTLEANKRRYFF